MRLNVFLNSYGTRREVGLLSEENGRIFFEYGTDSKYGNDKCKSLAKKIKEIIDTKSSFSDWLNNQRIRDALKLQIKICLVKNGYPPEYSPAVFQEIMSQVENYKENEA